MIHQMNIGYYHRIEGDCCQCVRLLASLDLWTGHPTPVVNYIEKVLVHRNLQSHQRLIGKNRKIDMDFLTDACLNIVGMDNISYMKVEIATGTCMSCNFCYPRSFEALRKQQISIILNLKINILHTFIHLSFKDFV